MDVDGDPQVGARGVRQGVPVASNDPPDLSIQVNHESPVFGSGHELAGKQQGTVNTTYPSQRFQRIHGPILQRHDRLVVHFQPVTGQCLADALFTGQPPHQIIVHAGAIRHHRRVAAAASAAQRDIGLVHQSLRRDGRWRDRVSGQKGHVDFGVVRQEQTVQGHREPIEGSFDRLPGEVIDHEHSEPVAAQTGHGHDLCRKCVEAVRHCLQEGVTAVPAQGLVPHPEVVQIQGSDPNAAVGAQPVIDLLGECLDREQSGELVVLVAEIKAFHEAPRVRDVGACDDETFEADLLDHAQVGLDLALGAVCGVQTHVIGSERNGPGKDTGEQATELICAGAYQEIRKRVTDRQSLLGAR